MTPNGCLAAACALGVVTVVVLIAAPNYAAAPLAWALIYWFMGAFPDYFDDRSRRD